jgi:Ca2+-binding RTX toxin-like protein
MGVLRPAALACALLVPFGCYGGPDEAVESGSEALSAFQNGAGAGPARFEKDPCANPRAFANDHHLRLIVGKPGERRIMGTRGRDLIVGTDGDDVIFADDGDDVVCAGYGVDVIHAGKGDDYVDAGGDNDLVYADEGNDMVHGRGGSDEIHGGKGDDLLFGDILDDRIYGEGGDDLLIGGHGTDLLDGGGGNDYLRGDTGNDAFIGGAGSDVASFVTAMPPGQGERVGGPPKISGVRVDFTNRCLDAGIGDGRKQHDGCANGDGGNEPLDDIELVVGSPYDDVFDPGGHGVKFVDVPGRPPAADGKVYAALERKARDTGLVVIGTDASDVVDVVREADRFRVRGRKGTKVFAGDGCAQAGDDAVCDPKHVLRWISGFMDGGGDVVKLAEAAGGSRTFPLDMTAHVSGGDGDDYLHGGDEQDVFFSGPTGKDHLFGNDGDDALLSESRKWPAKTCTAAQKRTDARCDEDKPHGGAYTDGADELVAGAGDDQLVADYPCGRHRFDGGGGKDIAGFARSGRFPLRAQLGGAASHETPFHGRAYNPALCGVADGTRIAGDLEILEAADGDDELWGNDGPNAIWGREGDDEIHGLGGNDDIRGASGHDRIFGGAGADDLHPSSEDTDHPDAD